jgi:hypothetical protein
MKVKKIFKLYFDFIHSEWYSLDYNQVRIYYVINILEIVFKLIVILFHSFLKMKFYYKKVSYIIYIYYGIKCGFMFKGNILILLKNVIQEY